MKMKSNIGRLCAIDWCGDEFPMELRFLENQGNHREKEVIGDSESLWRVVDESEDGTELIVEEVGRVMVLSVDGSDIKKAIICQRGKNEAI